MVVNLAFHFTLFNINTHNKLKMGSTLRRLSNVFINITELLYLPFSFLSMIKITATNTHTLHAFMHSFCRVSCLLDSKWVLFVYL